MPVLPASLIEPLWVEFAALIGTQERPEFSPTHPWGCHRRRVPDRVVFDHLIAALVHGSGYERIASPACSDRTLRRRLTEWAQAGHALALLRIALAAYDQMIGLDLDDLAVDGSITKAPGGGEVAAAARWTGASRAPSARWPPTGTAFRCIWSSPAPTTTIPRYSSPP